MNRHSLLLLAWPVAMSCCFDSSTRWLEAGSASTPVAACSAGAQRCSGDQLQICEIADDAAQWELTHDCNAEGKVCAPSLLQCTACLPSTTYCEQQQVTRCSADGATKTPLETCDVTSGHACRDGSCLQLCARAQEQKSNVGCEYWAVDLDNAMIDDTKNAAAQQFAVVVSNPQPDVPVEVHIHQDEGAPTGPAAELEIAQAVIAPLTLRVFKLGPREVDGSPPGEFNTGSHTALIRAAYRIRSDFPVVAYQFNPLENVGVFSNDASLLKPREALSFDVASTSLAYVVVGWPQTIAATDDPETNFNPANPIHLRDFLTIVGTRVNTEVIVHPSTEVVGGGPIPATAAGGQIALQLDAFDVANLETGDFNADFSGTLIEANQPIAVFVGSEASDAPTFAKLSQRRCCADHLEEQLDPVRTAGTHFALVHSPSRTEAVAQAGGIVGVAPEPEYVRFVATRSGTTQITTTLAVPDDSFSLSGIGDWHEVTAYRDFTAQSDQAIHVVQVMASQDAAGVPRGLPGGDPSLIVVPPTEQFRTDYVFLTPDKYAFDFITVVAPTAATVLLDDIQLTDQLCERTPADGLTAAQRGTAEPEMWAFRCQLSFPVIDPTNGALSPGQQNDGVHRVTSNYQVGVTVFGFDAYVSYAYAAGTDLREIAPPK